MTMLIRFTADALLVASMALGAISDGLTMAADLVDGWDSDEAAAA
jgi:hypothetical protein